MVLTWNQQLGSLPTEPRAESFLMCRQDYHFPPPINRGGFHGLNIKEIRLKNQKKPAFSSPVFFFWNEFSLLSSLPWLSATTTITISLTTILSTTSNCPTTSRGGYTNSFSLLCNFFFFLYQWLRPATTSATTSTTTTSTTTTHHPPWLDRHCAMQLSSLPFLLLLLHHHHLHCPCSHRKQ